MTPPAAGRRHNLPVPPTSVVGREREIAEVGRLLGAARLVTLAGTGGAGKTRLALQVAGETLDAFPDGVWFVGLAPLPDPGPVPHTVAAAPRWTGDRRRAASKCARRAPPAEPRHGAGGTVG